MASTLRRRGSAEEPWTLVDEERRLRAVFRQAAPRAVQLATSEVDRLAIKAQQGSVEAEAHLLGLFGDFIMQSATKCWRSARTPIALSVDQLGDLVQAGVEGLRIAIRGFRVESGKCFQNYARVVISRAIRSEARDERRLVAIPRHVELQLAEYRKHERELGHILGRAPSRTEIADRMQCSIEQVDALETVSVERRIVADALEGEFTLTAFAPERDKSQSLSARSMRGARKHGQPNPLSEEDILRAGHVPSPAEDLDLRYDAQRHWEQIQALRAALQTLDERPRTIFVAHYGLDGEAPRPFSKIAPPLRITRQRAEQVHAAGLVTLRELLEPLPPFRDISTSSNKGATHGTTTSAHTSRQ